MAKMSESMAEEWAKWLEKERSNLEVLEQRIEELSTNHQSPEGFQYIKFWAETDEISSLLETMQPLPRNEKIRLQGMLDSICHDIKKQQQRERREQQAQSRQSREEIEEKMNQAQTMADSAPDDIKTLNKAQALLKSAHESLKDGGGDNEAKSLSQKAALMRNDRQACWDKWREINDLIHERRQAIWDRNYQHIEGRVRNAVAEASDGNPHEGLKKIKGVQKDLKAMALNREHREEIKNTLNEAWDKAIFKVNEIREEKQRKFEGWLSQTEGQLEQLEEQLKLNQEESSRIQAEIEQFKEAIQSVRARDYGDSLREKIAGRRARLKELEVLNRQIEGRIQALRVKIEGQRDNSAPKTSYTNGPAEPPSTNSA